MTIRTFVESEILELKRSTSELKEAVCSIVAMLNKHGGGELYFGVKNDGKVVGQTVNEKTLRDVADTISNHIEPKIFPVIDKIDINGRSCVYVKFDGADVPYYAYGRAYIRVSDADKKISARELEKIILQKNKNMFMWDKDTSDQGIDMIEEGSLRNFIQSANAAGRLDFEFTDNKTVLNKLSLLSTDGKLFNAGKSLFSSHSDIEVQMAIFAGVDKLTFIDIKREEGTIPFLLQAMEDYLKKAINWSVKFGELEREETPEIPIKALREAIVNSLCHRDFGNPKLNELAVFKNRVEIYTPGAFPEYLTPGSYIAGRERSVLRNPLIARTLYFSKAIEEWGSGLKRIYNECSENNVKVEFSVLETGFLTTFYRPGAAANDIKKSSPKSSPKSDSKIIAMMISDSKVSISIICDELGIGKRALAKRIARLKENGVIERVGSPRDGYWRVLKK